MKYQRLGHSGLKVSQFSIGSWVTYGAQVDEKPARQCLLTAWELGVNYFDNAEAYGGGKAEEVVGRILAELPRDELVLSSKVFWGGDGPNQTGLSRKHVTEACHAALRRLRTDYLDLYFCHRPDPDTPVEETARAMDTLIRQGKVLYWGTSEWTAAQLTEAYEVCDRLGLTPPTMEQPQYNLLVRERVEEELVPLIEQRGLGTTIWSPLASGVLTGKYDHEVPRGSRLALENLGWLKEALLTEENLGKVRRLEPIAKALGGTRAQLALAWCAANPHVSTVITGASHPEQVKENLAAAALVDKLTPDVMGQIDAALAGR